MEGVHPIPVLFFFSCVFIPMFPLKVLPLSHHSMPSPSSLATSPTDPCPYLIPIGQRASVHCMSPVTLHCPSTNHHCQRRHFALFATWLGHHPQLATRQLCVAPPTSGSTRMSTSLPPSQAHAKQRFRKKNKKKEKSGAACRGAHYLVMCMIIMVHACICNGRTFVPLFSESLYK